MKTYVYQAIVTKDEDGAYDVEFPSLPGCFTFGDTLAEAGEQAVDAAGAYVATLLKNGEEAPEPRLGEVDEGQVAMLVAFSVADGLGAGGRETRDEALCARFGTSLGEVDADADLYERGDLDGMRFGDPVDGRPGDEGGLGGEVDLSGAEPSPCYDKVRLNGEPTREWMQAFVDRQMADGAGWDGALDALARAIGLGPVEGD